MDVIFSGLSFMHPFAHKGRSELIPLEQNRRGSLHYQSQHKYSHHQGRNKVIPSVAEFLTVSTPYIDRMPSWSDSKRKESVY
jgi:hypothetical protein